MRGFLVGDSGGVDDSDKLFNYTYSPALEDDTSENNTSLQALTTYDYLLSRVERHNN
jgi:hypothetical protein